MYRTALLGLALLSGCAVNPITGRDQFLALPAVQVAYADVGFALSTRTQGTAGFPPCTQDCASGADLASFAVRVQAIGAQLETSARDMFPEAFARIGRFRIEVTGALGIETGSSAGGRIALGSGLAGLEPTDTVIAFLIAREMAHVLARHAEEDSGASIVSSAVGILLPWLNVIGRFVATTLGSGALQVSWAAQQQREADDIALALMERTGFPARSVALGLESGVNRARLPDNQWGRRYSESTLRAAQIAASPPRYAVFGD